MVWFGLYICPDKPKPIYGGVAKEKSSDGCRVGWLLSGCDYRVDCRYEILAVSTPLGSRCVLCEGVISVNNI